MICIKKDPYLEPIVEDIEIGGPIVMMRYLNDSEVLYKLGQAMGLGVSGEIDTTKPLSTSGPMNKYTDKLEIVKYKKPEKEINLVVSVP
ncbi:hypothetical protein C5167_050555 [Papaver somniferum]|uniref:Uncharacterized protein n=1 Tax=Papaver somniferum TaxID=3469 RepID=A0A4Y7KRU7_PAPSO|nr:hypothetical protein C5167_050555 [Papaver somniferum]